MNKCGDVLKFWVSRYLDRTVRALGLGAGVAGVAIGAQNMLEATPGAGTGSVTAAMLADLGCRWL